MKKLIDVISGRDVISSIEARTKRLGLKIAKSSKVARRSVRFLDSDFKLFPGPNLIAAGTGRSKTSCAANLVHHTLQSREGLILCVLNEETEVDFYLRVACLQLSIPFKDAKFKTITDDQQRAINDTMRVLLERVIIPDDDEWNTNKLEDVAEIIESNYLREDVALIIVDYLQNINESGTKSLQSEPIFALSKIFGSSLKDFGKDATCPIVIFAQVRNGDDDVMSRIQNDKTFGNHCKTVLELRPDFENQLTDVYIAKDRFNAMTGLTLVFKFKLGALNYLSQKIQSYEESK